jgi:DNA modification methylase
MTRRRSRTIYFGDNLEILREHIDDASVDLVYLDPPFKSQQQYNVLFRTVRGEPAAAQVRAFSDTWRWDSVARATYDGLQEDPLIPGRVSAMIASFYQFIGPTEMMAYLVMMTPRLLQLHRTLRSSGSLYLHCDPAASHYLKIVLDTIFGPTSFRNEIIWRRTASHNQAKRFGPIHDTILFYTKTDDYFFTPGHRPLLRGHVEGYFRSEDERGKYWTNALTGAGTRRGESGQPWRGYDPTERGRHWAIPGDLARGLGISDERPIEEKLDALFDAGLIHLPPPGSSALPTCRQYLDQSPGIPYQDIWAYQPHTRSVLYESDEGIDEDVRWIPRQGSEERLGYQTQKPLGVLRRIIGASCPDDGLVLDPFCGCGTALAAAEELGRSWIGIDITYLAVDVMARRLREHFPGIDFEIRGQPQDVEGARALAERDRFQFQVWALSLIGGQPLDSRTAGADRGVDGYLSFIEEGETRSRAIVQVKSGHVGPREVRDLRGTLERERAPFAIFMTLERPTRDMIREAAEAGFYETGFTRERIARLQILTIESLLRGERPQVPTTQVAHTTRARRVRRREGRQLGLANSDTDPQIQRQAEEE